MYEDSIREEFTHQSQSFGNSAAMSSAQTLGVLTELVPADPKARWLDIACGPGVVSRALAARVGTVTGVDLTPAMVEEAKRKALEEGIANVSFLLGDATALDFTGASFDGAITRFSFHHIPVPNRVLARWRAWCDREDGSSSATRSPTTTARGPPGTGDRAPARPHPLGLAAARTPAGDGRGDRPRARGERLVPIEIDYEDWLARGSAGRARAR